MREETTKRDRFGGLAALYREALLDDVIPFWERHSVDRECGGYFTCLDRTGGVYDTDKFVWLQARQVWMFSMLHERLDARPGWLAMAEHGASFLREHGRDAAGNWYFSLDRRGRPLVQPYNLFSDCFAAMAFGQYARAAGADWARAIALDTYRNILRRLDDPKGKYSKVFPGTRPLRSLAYPMILMNVTAEMAPLLDADRADETIDACLRDVMGPFLDEERGILFENVSPDGSRVDSFEGRLILPGHGIEAMWFAMEAARGRGDAALAERAVEVVLRSLEFGWDEAEGGIIYYRDAEGHPPLQLEWDRKLWWVHLETLVALAMGASLTGRRECLAWYERVHDYAWSRFPDPVHGEWFGYLDRRGERFLDLKGGKWKGCFHVPRALYLCYREFDTMGGAGPGAR